MEIKHIEKKRYKDKSRQKINKKQIENRKNRKKNKIK